MARGTVGIAPVWVTETRAVTAGGTLLETWRTLLEKRSAIGPVTRFDTNGQESSIAACIKDLRQQGPRSLIHDLLERLLQSPLDLPHDTTIVTATTKSGIDNLERMQQGETADTEDMLPSMLPAIVGRRIGLTRLGVNVSTACASSTIAIARAAGMIRARAADSVLVVCLDLVTRFVYSGFSSLRILSPSPCRPFDRSREGLSLGEGAALLLLENPDMAQKRGRQCKGVVAGWGIANDADHIVTPAPDGRGLSSAITRALATAGCGADSIAGISAHGTGTIHNDRTELIALDAVFGNRRLPVYSVKGAIGHTLGAAGGIETAIALQAIADSTVPPTVGFSNGENGNQAFITRKPTAIEGGRLLVTNSGFGGVSCALVVEAGEA